MGRGVVEEKHENLPLKGLSCEILQGSQVVASTDDF